MSYILVIYTVVAMVNLNTVKDWRPIGEFHSVYYKPNHPENKSAEQRCREAAEELQLKPDQYKCLRNR